jgi:hypothetical protein
MHRVVGGSVENHVPTIPNDIVAHCSLLVNHLVYGLDIVT